MKAVILAGGLGTRISEETQLKPKPMIEIGGKPILWHIMKSYAHFGVTDFVICCGYMGYAIKEYFANYALHNSDITFDFRSNEEQIHAQFSEPWKVTLVDTGAHTMTGGRLLRIKDYIEEENFFLTYGDGLSNINIGDLHNFHLQHNRIATLTSVFPPGRFGALLINEDRSVQSFQEKPQGDGAQINGGFFVFNKEIFKYLTDDFTVLEQNPLQDLARESQLMAFEHKDFWQPMDTLRDKILLEELWKNKKAPWKTWK
mgnify:CR=1 FL=1